VAVRARRVELGAEQRDVVSSRRRLEGAAQLEGIDFRPCLVPRKEVVDRVKNAQAPIIASRLPGRRKRQVGAAAW
jgi:hypothetical protein